MGRVTRTTAGGSNNDDLLTFEEGEVILREGEMAAAAYLIKSGRVKVYIYADSLGNEVEIAKLGPGKIFGEMGLIKNKKHEANIKAVTKTVVHRVRADVLKKKLEGTDPLVELILKMLIDRIETGNQKVCEVKKALL